MLVKAIAGIKIMPTFAESKRINEYLITEVCESLTNVPFRHIAKIHIIMFLC